MTILIDAFGTLFDTQNKSVLSTKVIFSKYMADFDPNDIYLKWKTFHRQTIKTSQDFLNEKQIFILGLDYLFQQYRINGNSHSDVEIMLSSLYDRPLFNDVLPFLDKVINKYNVYIASNSDREPLLQNIMARKIKINGLFCSEDLKSYKPNRCFYESIIQTLKIDYSDILFIGDSLEEDVYAPLMLGMNSIWLNRKKLPNMDTKINQIPNLSVLSL